MAAWLAFSSMGSPAQPAAPSCSSALSRARELCASLPPRANTSSSSGEHELAGWWEQHEPVFAAARNEWGRRHAALYDLEGNEELLLAPQLREAVHSLEQAAAMGGVVDESIMKALLRQTSVPGVWGISLFTPRFCEMVIDEISHYERSGIPLRR